MNLHHLPSHFALVLTPFRYPANALPSRVVSASREGFTAATTNTIGEDLTLTMREQISQQASTQLVENTSDVLQGDSSILGLAREGVWEGRSERITSLHDELSPIYVYPSTPMNRTRGPHTASHSSPTTLPHASTSTNTILGRDQRERQTQRTTPYPMPRRTQRVPDQFFVSETGAIPTLNHTYQLLNGDELMALSEVPLSLDWRPPSMSNTPNHSLSGYDESNRHRRSQQGQPQDEFISGYFVLEDFFPTRR